MIIQAWWTAVMKWVNVRFASGRRKDVVRALKTGAMSNAFYPTDVLRGDGEPYPKLKARWGKAYRAGSAISAGQAVESALH